ncbi:uncharacterized protein LOC129950746 [Eupeodes corollae]|uniref:uncharacterized protein LOC129950746 n=1 Tax=Eupeodes corollae TaxID=290404 RepID=UPI0024935B62|nr:uncharacterized protein LOC129950746 [Eupeodes corollae]
MAQLPRARLGPFRRPFTFVGVDYFGPILVVHGRSQVKRWGVLFTCLTSRAIHIEVAFSLSTDSCILSIQRFIARRGKPSEFYSDNGTNFVGAEKELKDQFQLINKNALLSKFTSPHTKWYFNPPAAPHMGGSWERLIGTVKKILREVMGNRRLNDETFQSALIEIEAVVNSRPLTYVTLGPDDEEALTPNHFILGPSNGNKGLVNDNDRELMSRKDWRQIQQIANIFWKRWVREYLPTLTKRTKWFQKAEPVKTGDVVLIIDENLPRCTWPKGIITSTVISKDGQVRRATVKTASGVFDRPVARLALLNISQTTESKTAVGGAPLLGGGNVADVEQKRTRYLNRPRIEI